MLKKASVQNFCRFTDISVHIVRRPKGLKDSRESLRVMQETLITDLTDMSSSDLPYEILSQAICQVGPADVWTCGRVSIHWATTARHDD